jgi:hypothetical protein
MMCFRLAVQDYVPVRFDADAHFRLYEDLVRFLGTNGPDDTDVGSAVLANQGAREQPG